MIRSRRSLRSPHRWIAGLGALAVALTTLVGTATAHAPDPILGGAFG